MRLDAARLSIDVPDVFEDRTHYVFEERPFDPDKGARPDQLIIAFESMPTSIAPAGMTAHLRQAAERGGLGPGAMTEGRVKAGTIEAATLKVTPPGSPGGMFIAAFRWPGALMATVRYDSHRPDAAEVFDCIVQGVRPIGVRAKPPAGFVRRRAGRLWLEMPDNLAPPASCRFATPDERARIIVSMDAGPAGTLPDFDSWIDHAMEESLEVEEIHEGSRSVDGRPLLERAWCVDLVGELREHLGSTWFRAAWVSFADGGTTRILMIERGSPEIGEARWPELLSGLRLSAGVQGA